MAEEYIIHLYRFEVQSVDRRDGSEKQFILTIPYPGEEPEDLEETRTEIIKKLGDLGYGTRLDGITYTGKRQIGINMEAVYEGKANEAITIIREGVL